MKRSHPFFLLAGCSLVLAGGSIAFGRVPERLSALFSGQASFHEGGQLLLLLAGIAAAIAVTCREGRRYLRWRQGFVDQEDLFNAFSSVTPRDLKPSSVLEGVKADYYEALETKNRAERRWPRKREQLLRLFRAPLAARQWKAIGAFVGVQAFFLFGSWLSPRYYYITPHFSLVVTAWALALANLLVLIAWIAGDDDRGGARPPKPTPLPLSGLALTPPRLRTSTEARKGTTTPA